MKKFIFIILSVLTVSAYAGNVSWLRYPSISPDGKSVVFSYGGDLYIVGSDGKKVSGKVNVVYTNGKTKEHDVPTSGVKLVKSVVSSASVISTN